MKRTLIVIGVVGLAGFLFTQESFIKQSVVVNVEVPIRVFQGDRFIDNLSIKDFEVFENGMPQKIEAVYLIKKRSIERSEEKSRFAPETERNFFFFFEVAEYIPKLGEAMAYFIENILLPGDNLLFVTPLKTYRLKGQALKFKPRDQILAEMSGMIRKDAWTGNSEYRNMIKEMEKVSQSLASILVDDNEPGLERNATENPFLDSGGELSEQLAYYTELMSRLENMRTADQLKMLDFARFLKDKPGQKYVFVFYQQEFIPRIDPRLLQKYLYEYQDDMNLVMKLSELDGLSYRDASFDVELVKRSYADASTAIHFLFVKRPPSVTLYGVRHEERSEDIFSAFHEMARATGGLTITSSNPAASFRQAVDAAEQYYLLYYSPKEYLGDGTFKTIKVRTKDRKYRIHHRTGYFAN